MLKQTCFKPFTVPHLLFDSFAQILYGKYLFHPEHNADIHDYDAFIPELKVRIAIRSDLKVMIHFWA